MRLIVLITSISSLCILTACVTTTPSSGPGSFRPSLTQTYTNAPSQFCFPPRVGSFKREEVKQYDDQGLDIGVGYNDLQHGIAVTVFVYPIANRPPNNTLSGHFTACKAEVMGRHKNAQIVSESAVQISPGGILQNGQRGIFTYTEEFAFQVQPVRSELFVFTNGPRFIMFRATYPLGQQTLAEPAIKTFLDELAWP